MLNETFKDNLKFKKHTVFRLYNLLNTRFCQLFISNLLFALSKLYPFKSHFLVRPKCCKQLQSYKILNLH